MCAWKCFSLVMASFDFQLYTCRITWDESLTEDFLDHFGLRGNSLIVLVDVVRCSLNVGDTVSWVCALHGIRVEEVSREVGKGACFLSVLEHECDVTSRFKFLPMTDGNLDLWSKRNPFLPSSFMLRHLSQPQKGNEGTFVLCDILQSHLIKAFIVLISQTKVLNLRVQSWDVMSSRLRS